LGLKKTGVMPAVSPAAAPPAPGAPPAPFAQPAPTAVPSPFGQKEAPAPAPQPPPDPRRDPFSAQQQAQAANLAAFYGYGQALPGSAEAVSDTPISTPRPLGQIAVIAAVAAVGLGMGGSCGMIYKQRVEYNISTDHAAMIRDEVDKLAKNLNAITDTMRQSKPGTIDVDMAAKLGALDLKKPDSVKIFHTNYAQLEGLVVERLFSYYNDTIELYDEITSHAKKTDADKETIAKFLANGANKGDKNYGVIIDISGPLPLAHFVEVGEPVCAKEGQKDCNANELKGFKYRQEAGASWSERPVKGKPGETVTPLQATPLFKSIAAGGSDIIAVEAYGRRLKNISELVAKLAEGQKTLQTDLKKIVERPKLFTF
jgi:hypothetical protein